jgi:hypothetical protein
MMQAATAPVAPSYITHQLHKRSLTVVMVVFVAVVALAFYVGTSFLERSLDQLTLAVQDLREGVRKCSRAV